MQIDSAEKLIDALRASGLFSPGQLSVLIADLTAVSGDMPILLRTLVDRRRVTVYQLRKVIHGKSAELFLGPYVISDKLGEGGMGKVYRARHVRLHREVAIKVVRSNLLSNQLVRKRYDREVQIASSLTHPNIVTVYDAGEIDGKYYLAMEFVDGIDLSRLMRDYRPLAVAEACEYARQAALGLHYAHEQDLVHRDIKPSNIVVAGERHVPQATEAAVVKVLDMGLVRSVGFDDGGGGELTRAGTVVGTPDYMSPEQAKNSSGVDRRADLYSLGCTLYFLLIGQPPFSTGTAIEKLLKHQLDTPTPLQALRPDVPKEVAEIVAKLMAKRPNDRVQTAAEAAELLAPASRYPQGTPPVPIRARNQDLKAPPETIASAGRSTLPPLPASSSTLQPSPMSEAPVLVPQPVATSDHTPRPRDLPPALHATVEAVSPFSTLTEPPSGPLGPVQAPSRPERPGAGALPWQKDAIWIAVAAAALAVGAVGLWMAVGPSSKPADSSAPTGSEPGEGTSRTPAKPSPTPSPSRRLPWADLVAADPSMIAIATPSLYLRDRDSPFAGGAGRTGPGRLAAWAARLATSTGLPLVDSERIVLSFPAGALDRYLLVSEGLYLTPSFGDHLMSVPALRQQKPAKLPATVKWFQASANRVTALIPTAAGPQAYALSSDPQLLAGLATRLVPGEPPGPPLRIDPGMVAAIDILGDSPSVCFAVAGPEFRLPFEFQTLDRQDLALRDFGIDLVTAQLSIGNPLKVRVSIVGKDKPAVKQFLDWAVRKIGDEYPSNGRFLLQLLLKRQGQKDPVEGIRKADEEERVDNRIRVTFKTTLSPDDWSSALDRLFGP